MLDGTIAELVINSAHSLAGVEFFYPLRVLDCNESHRFLTEPLGENHN
jgi:hypothetical protein